MQRIRNIFKKWGLARKTWRLVRPIAFWTLGARHDALKRRLAGLLATEASIFVLQIGANDGSTSDPMYDLIREHPGWEGLFIEPLPRAFHQLQALYGDRPGLRLERIAISTKQEQRPLFFVRDDVVEGLGLNTPGYHSQLAGFDRNVIASHAGGRLAGYITSINVSCEPLGGVLMRHRISRIDVVLVDTEGFDAAILLQLDFTRYRPRAIIFEHKHLLSQEHLELLALLTGAGYRLRRYGQDTLGILEIIAPAS